MSTWAKVLDGTTTQQRTPHLGRAGLGCWARQKQTEAEMQCEIGPRPPRPE